MKKYLAVILIVNIVLCMLCINASAVTMYAPDGRTINVKDWEVGAYKGVGWYDNINDVKTTMYAADGRSMVVWNSEVATYENLGWHADINVVRSVLYAPDGRTMLVWNAEVEKYVRLGWYTAVTLYSDDGREISVPGYEVEKYRNVGWYTETDYYYTYLVARYDECVSAGDYTSALQWVSVFQNDFWGTEYEASVMKMKNTAMDVMRNRTNQPLYAEDYYVGDGKLQISLRNVSYKEIIAFQCALEVTDVFGNVIERHGYTNYYCDDTYLPSGESDWYTWSFSNSRAKWVNNIEVITVVYADGTIWNK